MPLLKWIQEYSVNDAELDRHHQKMFDILNRSYENVMSTQEVDCALPIIEELSRLAKCHIAAEEQHMREKGYPGIEAHTTGHCEFIHEIETLRNNYRGNNLEATKELIIMLGHWLLHHVINEDSKYSGLSAGCSGGEGHQYSQAGPRLVAGKSKADLCAKTGGYGEAFEG